MSIKLIAIGLLSIPLFFLAILSFFKLLKKPYITIILLIIASYMGYIGSILFGDGLKISLFHVFLIIAFIVFIYRMMFLKKTKIYYAGIEGELILFLAIIFLSIIYSSDRAGGLFEAFRFLILALMLYLVINSQNNFKHIKKLFITVVIVSFILGVSSILQGFRPENILINLLSQGRKLHSRASINVADPNIFASHFFIPIAFLTALVTKKDIEIKNKLLPLIVLPIMFAGVAATFSRSAWVAIFFIVILNVLMNKQYKIILISIFLFIIVLLILPQARLILQSVIQRFINIFSGMQDDSSRIRILLFLSSIYMAFDSYLLGVGMDGFAEHFTIYFSKFESIHVIEPHNIFYTVFAELGLFGLILYLWLMYKIGYTAYYNYKKNMIGIDGVINLSLFIIFLSYLIFYQFYDGNLFDNNFWIIVGMIFVVKKIQDKVEAPITLKNKNGL